MTEIIRKKHQTSKFLKDYIRLGLYDKRKKLADLKRKGYVYNRKEKAYILESDPFDSCYNYAVVVKSYEA